MNATDRRGVARAVILSVGLCLWSLMGCAERDGACPEVDSVSPAAAGAAEEVVVEGSDFAVGHEELFDDGARAIPPSVLLRFDPELNPLMPSDMADMEMDLPADEVRFRDASELRFLTPDIDWDDIASGLELMGMEVELPPGIPELPLGMRVVVKNPAGCEGQWGEAFTFTIAVDQGGSEEVTP